MTDDGWSLPEIGIALLRVHPSHLVGDEALLALQLWRLWQGGLAGGGPLPEAGGSLEQPSALIAAFQIMSAAEAALTRRSPHG